MTATTHSKLLTDDEIHDERICFAFMDWEHTAFKCGARWAERALLARLGEQQPTFWVRWCSDGCYEGPLHDSSIEDVRKRSGAWSPLYAHPPAAQPVAQGEREAFEAWAGRNFVQAPPTAIDFTQRPWSLMWLAWQAARSAAQGATQVPAWVSTKDRLPAVDGMAVAVRAPGAMQADVWPATWRADTQNFDAALGWFEVSEVTHWMPLPAAPSPAGERTSTEGDAQ